VLVNYRYPWGDRRELRSAYVEQLMISKERCLLTGLRGSKPGKNPATKSPARRRTPSRVTP
jgi:hypothetical protein